MSHVGVVVGAREEMLRRSQQQPLGWAVLWTVGVSTLLVSSVILCGLPYWRTEPWAAVIGVCCCAGLGAAGVLIQTERRTRLCGTLLFATGAAWALTWSQSWDSGPLPVVGQFAQSATFLALALAILRYVKPEEPSKLEYWWLALAVLVLGVGTAVSIVISQPQWMGYRAGVFWPHLRVSKADFTSYIGLLAKSFIVLAVAYGYVLLHVARRSLPRKYQKLISPLLVLIALGATVAAWFEQGSTLTNLDESLRIFTLQGVIGVLLLGTMLYTGLADRLAALRMESRLIARAKPLSMSVFRDALAIEFDDPAFQIYYRIPESDYYLDSLGGCPGTFNPRAGETDTRWPCQVFADSGALVAVMDVDRKLKQRQGLIDAARSVAGLLVMHSDLREEIRASGQRVQRQSQIEILQSGITERQRLERDLHDGAQQMLIALSMKMGAAEAADGPIERKAVAEWRKNLREATDELRNLARGIYPSTLREQGVWAALESLAERQTELRVDLDVPTPSGHWRPPPVIETSLYFAVAEAVANAAKHAKASRVLVHAAHKSPWLTCTVADDGTGMAAVRPGGGLEGIVNRIRVLGGEVLVSARPGEGSTIEMRLPCE